jgi:hypothetical protein
MVVFSFTGTKSPARPGALKCLIATEERVTENSMEKYDII